MAIFKSTYELLEPVISAMNLSVKIQTVVENSAGNYTIFSCDTKWATVGFTISIQGNDFKIISVVPNFSITITGGLVAPVKGQFNLYVPKFYHGTIQATEADLNEKTNNNLLSSDKLPMIWLHEPVDEVVDFQPKSAIERKSNCDLFFIIDANFSGWSNDDHYEQAIKPMRSLFLSFYEALKGSGIVNVNLIESFKINDLPRFGRYTATSGAKTAIFAQYEMSGVKCNITLPFFRQSCPNC